MSSNHADSTFPSAIHNTIQIVPSVGGRTRYFKSMNNQMPISLYFLYYRTLSVGFCLLPDYRMLFPLNVLHPVLLLVTSHLAWFVENISKFQDRQTYTGERRTV